ncbi:MAG: hypothetical protein FJX77_16930 [Armatimonadetes bacterium]|nr:hypothetical protein [Armatimonadota bacterium]
MYERGIEVEPVAVGGALPETLAEVWHPYFDRTYAHFCSHRHTPVEKAAGLPGALATANTLYFPHPLFASFMRHGLRVYKQLFLNALNRWLPDPILQTDAPTTAHLTVTRQPGRTLVHILHYVPEQRYRETPTIEDTLPLHDVGISLRADREPRQVTTGPDGAVLSHEWRNGRVEFRVPRVIGYGIVEVQDAAP